MPDEIDADAGKPGEPGIKSNITVRKGGLAAAFGGIFLVIALLVGQSLFDEDDRDPSPAPTVASGGSAAGTQPQPTPSTAGSAQRLTDLFAGLPGGDLDAFPGLDQVGDIVEYPTSEDLWAGLEPQTQQFTDAGYQGGQQGALELARADPAVIPEGVVSLVTIQRWELADAGGAAAAAATYQEFVSSSYGAPAEEGTVGVGDGGGVTLVSRSPGDTVTTTFVSLTRLDGVALMIQGSCLACTPDVEQEGLADAATFAEAFFAE